MPFVSLILDIVAACIAALAIPPLRDVTRLARSPALKRSWQALTVAVIACIALVTLAAVSKPPAAPDAGEAAGLLLHVIGASLLLTFARLARWTARDILRLSAFEAQAFTDELTGLGNRRMFDVRLEEEAARAQEAGLPLSLIVLDIDHFKRVNDTFGHAVGDVVIRHVAATVAAVARNADTVCRIGGEEFVVIVPRLEPALARDMAEAVRDAVRSAVVPAGNGRTVAATVSLGFATLRPGETVAALFARADGALYAAKRGGRDQVRLAA